MRVGVHVFEGAEELDWVGPWEVLASWAANHPEDEVDVVSVARETREVRCAKGLRVVADHTWEDVGGLDVIVYPGGRGTRDHVGDSAVRAWLRGLHDAGTLIASVCTGPLVLADAGLLDAAPATTHWSALDDLARLGRGVEVRGDERFVDNGAVITAAGVSAGIDMALHLVARLHTAERARDVRRYIQYDPAPPV